MRALSGWLLILAVAGSCGPVRPPARTVAASKPARTMTVEATAYCLRGRTASGTPVRRGVIAVDPRVIPLGTRVYVEGYGPAVARDTGGAIRGRRCDVWLASRAGCYDWGRRRVRIITNYNPGVHGARPFATRIHPAARQ
jgi:3D (Asp-Asp-Asp) domain-containing protein